MKIDSAKMIPDEIDISPEQNRGVLKKIIQEGEGTESPTSGCEVEVCIKNLTSSPDDVDGTTTKFNLGKGKIVKGCEIGIATMTKGEVAIFTCTAPYANVYPSVSETTTLKFHVELIDWQYEDISPKKDGGIRRVVIAPGEGNQTPNEGTEVEINLIGKFEDKVFDHREKVCFYIGEGEEHNIVQGIDLALGKFKKGETSKLFLKPQYAFGEEGFDKFEIPPNSNLEYEVTLVRIERAKDIWLMTDDEKIKEAKELKKRGNLYFQKGKLQLAIILYRRVIQMLKLFEDGRHIMENDAECESTFFTSHMNLCLCYLKTENFSQAKHSVKVALMLRPEDEKAHFRAGKVYFALGEYYKALEEFEECLNINPNNKAALAEIKLSTNALIEHKKQERKIYGQMFDRFAEADTQREKSELKKICNVMSSVGEWGAEDREREPSEFEKENPDILLLNKTGEFKDM